MFSGATPCTLQLNGSGTGAHRHRDTRAQTPATTYFGGTKYGQSSFRLQFKGSLCNLASTVTSLAHLHLKLEIKP
jgi:hypothetical protein